MKKGNYWINNGKVEKVTTGPIPAGWMKGRLKSSTKGAIDRARNNHPMLGKHHSKSARDAISLATKGENNPFYGRHHSAETRIIISESAKGREGYWKGKHLSSKSRSKISESRAKYVGVNHPRYGKHWDNDHKQILRDKQISYLRNRDEPFVSNTELKIRNYLSNYFELIPQFHFSRSSHRYDMLIKLPNEINLLLEYDGSKFHKDLETDPRELEARLHGYEFLVIKESDYHANQGLKYVKSKVAEFFPDLLSYHLHNHK